MTGSVRASPSMLAAAVLALICLALIGQWVAGLATRQVLHQAAAIDALRVAAMLQPGVTALGRADVADLDERATIARLLAELTRDSEGEALMVRLRDGTVIGPSRSKLPEPTVATDPMPETGELDAVWSGQMRAELLSSSGPMGATGTRFRVLIPLRSSVSDAVIAVADLRRSDADLGEHLTSIRLKIWLAVGLAASLFLAMLFAFARQRRSPEEPRRLQPYAVSESLQGGRRGDIDSPDAERAQHVAYAIHEGILRRIGTDLHDGPAQLLSLALLRLEELEDLVALQREHLQTSHDRSLSSGPVTVIAADPHAIANCTVNATHCLKLIRTALTDCLRDIRVTSSRLASPEVEARPVAEIIATAIRLHAEISDGRVEFDFSPLEREPDLLIKLCLYRVVQEGLGNVAKHAAGSRTRIVLAQIDDRLALAITDDGQGAGDWAALDDRRQIDADHSDLNETRLGLRLLRNRVESLGGTFSVDFRPGQGTDLNVQFDLSGD